MDTRFWVSTALLWVLTGCGYGFTGRPAYLPPDAETISIRPFENVTREVGVEFALVAALKQVVREHGVLQVVPGERGDLLLTGKVRDLRSRPVGFSDVDRVKEYEHTLIVDADLRRRIDGTSLWSGSGLAETFDAPVVSGLIIASSPRVQQKTIDPADLSGISSIQLAEDQRGQGVLRDLVDPMARSIYSQMMEGF